jgi:putative ABC transport system permease protein
MIFTETMQTAYKALLLHKMRSVLTMLGIIIGVGSVVLMVSVGKSFENYILRQIDTFGSTLMELYPTGFEKFGRTTDSLTFDDYKDIERLESVQDVAPVIFMTEKVFYASEEISPYIFGTFDAFFGNYGLTLSRGRLLNAQDEKAARSVAVLGHSTAEDLFGQHDPLGKRIRVGNHSFQIVGVLESVGSALLQDLDTPVYIPFSTARAKTGQKELSYMSLRATGDIDFALQDVTQLLRQRHGIDNPTGDPDKDDFRIRAAEQAADIVGQVTLGLTIFIGLIAGMSLLVGGIGIMNIMLVSVAERTREIGLRKAVGAKRMDILLQFLSEAIFLTIIGGGIGIIGGALIGRFIAAVASVYVGYVPFVLSMPALLSAVCMALATGVIFGLYPAKKAANLSPMEAIRWY